MERGRLSAIGIGAVALLLGGCIDRSPPPAVPTLVVAVAPVKAAGALDATGVERASSRPDPDGRAPGDRVDVEWRSSWYPAVLLERRADGWLVHYEDYGDEWDEVVDRARIRDRSLTVEPMEVEDDTDP